MYDVDVDVKLMNLAHAAAAGKKNQENRTILKCLAQPLGHVVTKRILAHA